MAERHFDPEALRQHVVDALAHLSDAEHLAALRAIDRGDCDLDLTEAGAVRVTIHGHGVLEVPKDEATVIDGEA